MKTDEEKAKDALRETAQVLGPIPKTLEEILREKGLYVIE